MAYTSIDNSELHHQSVLYTGNATDNTAIVFANTTTTMQPDWVWNKNRAENNYEHHGVDSVRGVDQLLRLSADIHEFTSAPAFRSFDSNGFTLGSNSYMNVGSDAQVSWCWKMGTSFSNDASATSVGSIDSAGSINTDAGQAIITYTGTGSNGTIAHGLGAVPTWVMIKNRSATSGDRGWAIYHVGGGNTHFWELNTTAAKDESSGLFNNTTPTSSVFSIGTNSRVNTSGDTYVAYVFADVPGYSKFSTWVGDADSSDGPFVYLGFKPAFIMYKSSASEDWEMLDNKRVGYNFDNNPLKAHSSDAEATTDRGDLLSNGFKIRTGGAQINGNGTTYIYMAFAESPFVSSSGVPTTAR